MENIEKLGAAKDRIKIKDSICIYLKDSSKEIIWKAIDESENEEENPSTVIRVALELLNEQRNK
jgi:hypothetical protein